MAITATQIINEAKKLNGYKATRSSCIPNNWFYGENTGGDIAWCAAYVCYVFHQAGADSLIPVKSANCGDLARGFYDKGQIVTSSYKAGDIVFFHWSNKQSSSVPGVYTLDHVGIIVSVNSNGTYTTIEGNTGDSDYGECMIRTRYASQISCCARPKYNAENTIKIKGTKGVDISYAQDNIDMSKVKKAGYNWVMIRIGQGTRITDSQFASNVEKAEKLGMPWGAYLLTEATTTAAAQAEVNFAAKLLNAQIARGYKPSLPIAIDIEEAGYNSSDYTAPILTNTAKVWVDGMKKLGFYPMIYTGYYDIKDYISKEVVNSTDIWLAEWGRYPDYTEDNLGIWQYGGETNLIESNSIDGVGVIDKDLAYKEYPTIIINGGYNGWNGGVPSVDTKEPSIYAQGVNSERWTKVAKDGSTYTGVIGKPLTGFAVKVTDGNIEYSAHVKGGNWLGNITGWNYKDYNNGYAGNGNPAEKGSPIDCIKIYYKTPSNIIDKYGYYKVAYKVHVFGGDWLEWQYDTETSNGQDGYAGIYGKTIDAIQVKLVKA